MKHLTRIGTIIATLLVVAGGIHLVLWDMAEQRLRTEILPALVDKTTACLINNTQKPEYITQCHQTFREDVSTTMAAYSKKYPLSFKGTFELLIWGQDAGNWTLDIPDKQTVLFADSWVYISRKDIQVEIAIHRWSIPYSPYGQLFYYPQDERVQESAGEHRTWYTWEPTVEYELADILKLYPSHEKYSVSILPPDRE